MNDKELNEVLKRATVPEREPDYWERFPGRVIGEIERRTRSASTPSRTQAAWWWTAALRFDGQLAVFDARLPESPCYHCIFGEAEEIEETRCAVMGVFAPLVGVIGSMQAVEALKLLAECGEPAIGKLFIYDALGAEWRTVKIRRDPECPVCESRT